MNNCKSTKWGALLGVTAAVLLQGCGKPPIVPFEHFSTEPFALGGKTFDNVQITYAHRFGYDALGNIFYSSFAGESYSLKPEKQVVNIALKGQDSLKK